MKKIITLMLVATICLTVAPARAHQPNISSVTLIRQEEGDWTIQLNASLTAFQYIVKNEFGADSYASPEEFNELIMVHFKDNLSLYLNETNVALGQGFVKLGHASAVVFELSEVPSVMNQIQIKNEGFKNIPHSQCVFSVYRQGMDQDHYILSEENGYQVKLSLKDDQLLLAKSQSTDYRMILFVSAIVIGLMLVVLLGKKLRFSTLRHVFN